MLDVGVLPTGPTWSAHTIIVEGAVHTYVLHVFKRNVIEVTRELISDPKLEWDMCCAPERHWTLIECLSRIYNETWTGDWWWEMQVSFKANEHSSNAHRPIHSVCLMSSMNSGQLRR